MENKTKEVNLGSRVVGEVAAQFDVAEYIGKKSRIARIVEKEGQYGFFIVVETDPLKEIEGGEGETISIKASRLFGLAVDKDDQVGWTKNSKLAAFLKKMKVSHYRDLIGKEVIIQTRTSDDGVDYLTF